MAFPAQMLQKNMGCRRTLFQPGLKIKKNFLLRLKNLRTNAKKVRESNYPDIDNVVFKWFLSQRGKSIPIDGTFIKEKTMKYAKELGATDFKASDGWLGRWKKR